MASYSTDDAQDQIAALRKQVNQLMSDRVNPMISDAADSAKSYAKQAQGVAKQASSYAQDQSDVVAEQVRGRPLAAIAIAAAVGYVLGRFVR